MRISLSSWVTSEDDVELSLAAMLNSASESSVDWAGDRDPARRGFRREHVSPRDSGPLLAAIAQRVADPNAGIFEPAIINLENQSRVRIVSRRSRAAAPATRASLGGSGLDRTLSSDEQADRAFPQYISRRVRHGLRLARPGAGRTARRLAICAADPDSWRDTARYLAGVAAWIALRGQRD